MRIVSGVSSSIDEISIDLLSSIEPNSEGSSVMSVWDKPKFRNENRPPENLIWIC